MKYYKMNQYKHTLETIDKIRTGLKGNKNHLGFKHSQETKSKCREAAIKAVKEGRQNHNCGDKHWNWKGGKTDTVQGIRNSIEYRLWRKSVFERDNYTCKMCSHIGGELRAHHLWRFSEFPELRFAINNGITLCRKCHTKIHK